MKRNNPTKELYNQLRTLSCEALWNVEVTRFDHANDRERMDRVAVVRAVGVVFSEQGTEAEKERARTWLRGLLHDPNEKVRRYAMTALPKLGAGTGDESELLGLLKTTTLEREKRFLGQALEKIGGKATLEEMERASGVFHPQTLQKVRANLVRDENPSSIRTDTVLPDFSRLRIHLRGRRGLEGLVREEVEARMARKFRVEEVRGGLVVVSPIAPFSIGDIYSLRCFGSVGFVLGTVADPSGPRLVEELARLIASPLSKRILKTFTEGSLRYRLDFVSKGHQRSMVRLVADRAYSLCPEILNDAHHARWTVAIHPAGQGSTVELCPKLAPDPRFAYRQQDVPAASHPPLAACMARLAGCLDGDIVWDPFCGSGLELIERTLQGGVRAIYGTDLSPEAVAITQTNFAAAIEAGMPAKIVCCDFRDFATVQGLGPGSATLIITNPPLGKRVPIPNLNGLIKDLFSVAATVLKPGGRLVFANPFRMESPQRLLQLKSRRTVDFGGFDCYLEKYVKLST